MLRPGMYLQNRYEILDQIGSGGMSEVYRAKCHKLNRLVAIKVLKEEFSTDAGFVKKFKLEAQAAAGLSHPNIVSVYDVVDEGSIHYIVMELIEGITLKSYITKKGRLGSKEAIGIAIQVAQGIAAAHDQHIVHRDIKPQNMIISRDGKVKVADFGIARAVSNQTIGATAIGSVHYISPEQARGGFSDSRTDIYSLGITMFEMVTGTVPFDGDNTVSIALAHLEQAVTPPSRLNPEVPVSLDRIIMKCTQKKPERRYRDVYELIADLRHALVDPDDDFITEEPEVDTSSPTMVISNDDLSQIKQARNTGPVIMNGQSSSMRAAAETGQHDKRRDREYGSERREAHGRRDGRSGENRSQEYEYDEYDTYDDYQNSAHIPASGNSSSGKKARKQKRDADINPQIEKLLTSVGVVAAIIIVAVLITIFAKLGGIFNSGSGGNHPAQTSGQETGLKDTETRVPDFTGLTEDEAEKEAEENHLKLSYGYVPSEEKKKGRIIEQKTAEGTVVDKQSTIKVIVGEGGETESEEETREARQIDLTVLGLEALDGTNAKNLLEAKGLTVSLKQENSDTIPENMVVRYEPQEADRGEEITLYVSLGPAVSMVKVPDLKGMTEEEAGEALAEAGLLPAPEDQIVSQKSDSVKRGTIISQTPLMDEEVPEGSTVSYVISEGRGKKYAAIVNDDYPLKDNFGPSGASTTITVEIVMVQTVNGQKRTTTVMDARNMKGDVTLPVHYELTGADGVLTGELQIWDLTNDRILKTYPLEFMEVDA